MPEWSLCIIYGVLMGYAVKRNCHIWVLYVLIISILFIALLKQVGV